MQQPVQHEITRRIWGDSDVVLLVFAGAAAEFAVSRAVDWLFVTGNLPRDPVGRMFATLRYAQAIAFESPESAHAALARIRRAHAGVEALRQGQIPAWAYRAVLYLLIDYSERAFRMLERSLTRPEQDALYSDFRRIGEGLHIPELPATYDEWSEARSLQLERDLAWSADSATLYQAYRRDLGAVRYRVLLETQGALLPGAVRNRLALTVAGTGRFLIGGYRLVRGTPLGQLVRQALFPPEHRTRLRQLHTYAADNHARGE